MIEPGVSRLRAIGTKAGVTVLAPAAQSPEEIARTLLDLADLMLWPGPAPGASREDRRERVLALLDEIIDDEKNREERLYG